MGCVGVAYCRRNDLKHRAAVAARPVNNRKSSNSAAVCAEQRGAPDRQRARCSARRRWVVVAGAGR